jgi:hypothetical protein
MSVARAGMARAFTTSGDPIMTICPIALAVGCKKCPAFAVCPLKGVLGDQKKGDLPAASTKKTDKS